MALVATEDARRRVDGLIHLLDSTNQIIIYNQFFSSSPESREELAHWLKISEYEFAIRLIQSLRTLLILKKACDGFHEKAPTEKIVPGEQCSLLGFPIEAAAACVDKCSPSVRRRSRKSRENKAIEQGALAFA